MRPSLEAPQGTHQGRLRAWRRSSHGLFATWGCMTPPIPASRLLLKRVYAPPAADGGTRVLVDRLWPRGVSKARAALDFWNKDVAPSTELRTWFGHDPARWQEFCT